MKINKLDKIDGILKNIPLASLTSFGMGGSTDYFFKLKNIELLPSLIEATQASGLPWIILGCGSNMIFSDKGFRGLIIHNLEQTIKMDGNLLMATSGTLLSQIIQFALKHGLVGMEKLIGIPGTIGGAVRGNAGAFGVEITSLFEKAQVYRPISHPPFLSVPLKNQGEIIELKHDYFKFGYRYSTIKYSGEIILKVWLKLKYGNTETKLKEVRQIIMTRSKKHPIGKSSGSFFKNPPKNSIEKGLSAGYLIDQCGFKGKCIGGVYISEIHGNFFMNNGKATMEDVLKLCLETQQTVRAKFGIQLEREVQLVGENGIII